MILELKDVESAYGLSQILFGVSLDVEQSESVSLIGRNGVGKTTTIKTIMGMLRPLNGEIIYDGKKDRGNGVFQDKQAGHRIRSPGQARISYADGARKPRVRRSGRLERREKMDSRTDS